MSKKNKILCAIGLMMFLLVSCQKKQTKGDKRSEELHENVMIETALKISSVKKESSDCRITKNMTFGFGYSKLNRRLSGSYFSIMVSK